MVRLGDASVDSSLLAVAMQRLSPLVLALGILLTSAATPLCAQSTATRPGTSIAARLGYPDSARLVILHADDIAMTPGVSRVTLSALERGVVNSASIIAPTAYLGEFARSLPRGHRHDLGIHLTLTSESALMRWRPASGDRAKSLLDSTGTLALRPPASASAAEIEQELDAQIAAIRAAGIVPTHLDSHQGALYTNGDAIFSAWRRVAKRACMTIPIPTSLFAQFPYLADGLKDGHLPINDMRGITPAVANADWDAFYQNALRDLKPGVTELIVHLDEDTDAERAQFKAHVDGKIGWDAAWRARDLHALAAPAFRQLLREQNIHLVTWREIAAVTDVCPR
jgi:chitin disaccharide deacetylase